MQMFTATWFFILRQYPNLQNSRDQYSSITSWNHILEFCNNKRWRDIFPLCSMNLRSCLMSMSGSRPLCTSLSSLDLLPSLTSFGMPLEYGLAVFMPDPSQSLMWARTSVELKALPIELPAIPATKRAFLYTPFCRLQQQPQEQQQKSPCQDWFLLTASGKKVGQPLCPSHG